MDTIKTTLSDDISGVLKRTGGIEFQVETVNSLADNNQVYRIKLEPGLHTIEKWDGTSYVVRQTCQVLHGKLRLTNDYAAVSVYFDPNSCRIMFRWPATLPSFIAPQKVVGLTILSDDGRSG